MRNLTITRRSTFVGCAASLKVWIEDNELGTMEIGGVKCRMLGKIKNGDTRTFPIDEASRRVYVIADKLSKNYCNEFKTIPAGEEDVILTGRPHWNPLNGNAFQFDGIPEPEVLANRKKNRVKGGIVLAVAVVVGFAIGFILSGGILDPEPEPQDFTYRNMTITLTEDFEKSTISGDVDAAYLSHDVGVNIIHESIAGYPELAGTTPEDYAEILILANDWPASAKPITEDGLTYVTYQDTAEDGDVIRYYIYTYTTEDICCGVQFYVYENNADEYRDDITAWAKSVTFAE